MRAAAANSYDIMCASALARLAESVDACGSAVKVTPQKQTLLLASDRRMNGDVATPLDKALTAASNGGVLKRLTIVASQPDTSLVVVVSADYAPPPQPTSSALSVALPVTKGARSDYLPGRSPSARDAYGNPYRGSELTASAHLQPTEQYARTQRLSMTTPLSAHVDLLA